MKYRIKNSLKARIKQNEAQTFFQTLSLRYEHIDVATAYPTLHQAIESNEFNFLDLPRLQAEVERGLASVSQRLSCLTAESKNQQIPLPILQELGLLAPDDSNKPSKISDLQQRLRSSLVVKANPNKPLSLIISSRRRSQSSPTSIDYNRDLSNRRISTTANYCSPDNNVLPGYDIPNRFWAYTEPYCADISEANILYLENILKTYAEEAANFKYFNLPVFATHLSSFTPSSQLPAHLCNVPKRLRKDWLSRHSNDHNPLLPDSRPELSKILKVSSDLVYLARCIDLQLRQPQTSAQSIADQLACRFEKELYQLNIKSPSSLFSTRLQEGIQLHFYDPHSPDLSQHPIGQAKLNQAESIEDLISRNGLPLSFPLSSGSRLKQLLEMTAQPIKNLARQLQVSSSFRIEKKVSQAVEELGLFPLPLYLSYMAHRPTALLVKLGSTTPSSSDPATTQILDNKEKIPKISLLNCSAPHTRLHAVHNDVCHDKKFGSTHSIRPFENHLPIESMEPIQSYLSNFNACLEEAPSLNIPNGELSDFCNNYQQKTDNKIKLNMNLKLSLLCEAKGNNHTPKLTDQRQILSACIKDDCVILSNDSVKPTCNGISTSVDETEPNEQPVQRRLDDDFDECLPIPRSPLSKCHQVASPNGHSIKTDEKSRLVNTDSTEPLKCMGIGNAKKMFSPLPGYSPPPVEVNDEDSLKAVNGDDGAVLRFRLKRKEGRDETLYLDNASKRFAISLNVQPSLDLSATGVDKPSASPRPHVSAIQRASDAPAPNSLLSDNEDDLSSCILNLAAKLRRHNFVDSAPPLVNMHPDEVTLALLHRQRELLLVCAANHSLLHRLIQAARRDLQRQEIQRRLAIADADVLEVYGKIENCRLQKRQPYKRDRDAAWKMLKEREKLRNELEVFDRKAP